MHSSVNELFQRGHARPCCNFSICQFANPLSCQLRNLIAAALALEHVASVEYNGRGWRMTAHLVVTCL